MDVIGGLYKANFDAWIAGAIGTWVTMNASITGALFEDNQVCGAHGFLQFDTVEFR